MWFPWVNPVCGSLSFWNLLVYISYQIGEVNRHYIFNYFLSSALTFSLSETLMTLTLDLLLLSPSPFRLFSWESFHFYKEESQILYQGGIVQRWPGAEERLADILCGRQQWPGGGERLADILCGR